MAALAVKAAGPTRPPETKPGSAHVLYRRPVAGPGAQRLGPFVAPRATERNLQLTGEGVSGEGSLGLLTPGVLWAGLGSRSETFEARLRPARLIEVDAVRVPHVAGTLGVHLHSGRDVFSVRQVEESRLIRFDRPRRLNGRVRVQSRSKASEGEEFIHAMGGLELYSSDWARQGEIRVPFQSPAGGTITSLGLKLRPGGERPSPTLFAGGQEASLPAEVGNGDPLEIRATVGGTVATTLARIELSIS